MSSSSSSSSVVVVVVDTITTYYTSKVKFLPDFVNFNVGWVYSSMISFNQINNNNKKKKKQCTPKRRRTTRKQQQEQVQASPNSSTASSPATPVKKQRTYNQNTYTLDQLRPYFFFAISEAAEKLKIGISKLKFICRQLKIGRWPYRKVINNVLAKMCVVHTPTNNNSLTMPMQ
eukprot:GEZU01017242.1.p1 GENE.GEZU01017242.1~~GEZU01017242.1.p1  ORF type:complete len:174 (+),score=38.76 GEZU01017242.1:554-1075(+)